MVVQSVCVCVGQNLLRYDYTYACIFFLEIPIQSVWKMVQYNRQCFYSKIYVLKFSKVILNSLIAAHLP